MGTQLWTLALAQVLDIVFAEHSDEPLSETSRRRLVDSMDRVAGRPKGMPDMALSLGAAFASGAIDGRFGKSGLSRWGLAKPGLAFGFLQWLANQGSGQATSRCFDHVRELMGKRGWDKTRQRVLDLLSLDVPSIPMSALTYPIGRHILRSALPHLYWPALIKALEMVPGGASTISITVLDGTTLFHEPVNHLRRAPGMLRDTLSLFPGPLVATVLVGGAFLRGTDVDNFWAALTCEDEKDTSTIGRWRNRVASALGYRYAGGPRSKVRSVTAAPGAVVLARGIQNAAAFAQAIGYLQAARRRR